MRVVSNFALPKGADEKFAERMKIVYEALGRIQAQVETENLKVLIDEPVADKTTLRLQLIEGDDTVGPAISLENLTHAAELTGRIYSAWIEFLRQEPM